MDLTEPEPEPNSTEPRVGKQGKVLPTKILTVLALIANIQADTLYLQAVEMGRVQVLRCEAPPSSGIGSLST